MSSYQLILVNNLYKYMGNMFGMYIVVTWTRMYTTSWWQVMNKLERTTFLVIVLIRKTLKNLPDLCLGLLLILKMILYNLRNKVIKTRNGYKLVFIWGEIFQLAMSSYQLILVNNLYKYMVNMFGMYIVTWTWMYTTSWCKAGKCLPSCGGNTMCLVCFNLVFAADQLDLTVLLQAY